MHDLTGRNAMKLRSELVAALALFVLLLTGCVPTGDLSSSDGGDTSSQDGSGNTSEENTTPVCPEGSTYDSGIEECVADAAPGPDPEVRPIWLSSMATCSAPEGVDFEGYFDNTEMYDYLDCIVPSIDAWIDLVYASMPHPAGYMFIPVGAASQTACIDPTGEPAIADEAAALYCPADEIVYLGEQATYDYYSNQGDASMAMAVAHEVGHHFEKQLGIFELLAMDGQTLSDTIATENLSDCISGAYVNYLSRNGYLNVEDDIEDLASVLVAIAAAEDDVTRDHGTLDERLNSFSLSFQSTMESPLFECNYIIEGVTVVN